jgi:type VI secretion system Hcp family effector
MKDLLVSTGILLIAFTIQSQNVGIGQLSPSEKLEVNGIVYSNQGGIKFPDLSIQSTAAYNVNPEDAAENRKFIVMEIQVDGTDLQGEYTDGIFTEATKVIAADIQHANAVSIAPCGAGILAGGAQWKRFDIKKELDKTSPELQAVLFDSRLINTLKLHFIEKNQANQLVNYYRIEILNGTIYDISTQLVYQGNSNYAHIEHLSLIYNSIIFTSIAGGEEHQHTFTSQ